MLNRVEPSDSNAYADTFAVGEEETLESLIADFDAAAKETEQAIEEFGDLGRKVAMPTDAPWYPADPEGFSGRWILLHIMEELARHAGHADIIREHVDGATMYELMAAAEGWPETDWLKPWKPKA